MGLKASILYLSVAAEAPSLARHLWNNGYNLIGLNPDRTIPEHGSKTGAFILEASLMPLNGQGIEFIAQAMQDSGGKKMVAIDSGRLYIEPAASLFYITKGLEVVAGGDISEVVRRGLADIRQFSHEEYGITLGPLQREAMERVYFDEIVNVLDKLFARGRAKKM